MICFTKTIVSYTPGGGGTPIHYLYRFEAPDLERDTISEAFSITGYNISNARKLQFCKQPFEIIRGQIVFKNTVQCVNNQTVVLLLHPVFQRAGRAYFGASCRASRER